MSRPFQLLIKPVGADCNLRCRYCFYLRAADVYAEAGRHVMAAEVLEKIVGDMLGLRLPQSVFSWQGGEPTLAGLDFFRNVVRLQQQYGAPGQEVCNSIQTNGLLIDEDWCRFFREYHMLVGLSLDGPREVHDAVRQNGAGEGSWERVMASARLMEQQGVDFNVLCVLNNENAALGADLVRWFVEAGFRFMQFIPCMERESPYNVSPEQYGAFLCDAFDYWIKAGPEKIYIRDFHSMLAQAAGVPDRMCIYGRRCADYILIEHQGDVFPCDFFMYPEWNLGNVMESPLASFVETARYREFGLQKDAVAACRGCTWRAMCHGGCQKDRLAVGGLVQPTPYCGAYKRFFAHAMPRLQGLAGKVRRRQAKQG